MMHKATSAFWAHFRVLPHAAQALAKKNFQLLKENPHHPSLHFKKIGMLQSVRIGLDYRALGVYKDGCCYWHWIGTHADYDRML